MNDSAYYPPGAYNDPNAPYNQPKDPGPVEVDTEVSISLYHGSVPTFVSNYTLEPFDDYDVDCGKIVHSSGVDYNFEDTNFEQEYLSNDISVINLLKSYANKLAKEVDTIEDTVNSLINSLDEAKKFNVDKNRIKTLSYRIGKLREKAAIYRKHIEACLGWTVTDINVEKS